MTEKLVICKLQNNEVIVLLFVSPTCIDVFTGVGWYNWSRFDIKRIKGKVFLHKVNGKPLKAEEFKELCQHLE